MPLIVTASMEPILPSDEVHATSSSGNTGSIEAVTINGIEYNSN